MKGLTILETMIAVSVIGIVSMLFYTALSEFHAQSSVGTGANIVMGVLRDARARTLSGKSNMQYGVHFETTRTVLFEGAAYNTGAPTNEVFAIPTGAHISTINLGGASDIIFSRITGFASASGTVIVSAVRNVLQTKTISIVSTGIIQ